ncbi:hypothetical protein Tco_0982816 [Tanacetum coccineum]
MAQRIKSTLYDGSVISSQHVACPVIDDEETLILEELKGKETIENVAQILIATTIAPGMFKIDLDPLAPRLLNNREAHIDYLKNTQEEADVLRGIVE